MIFVSKLEIGQQLLQSQCERAGRLVVPDVGRVFAAAGPFGRDSQLFADAARSSLDQHALAKGLVDVPRLCRVTLAATRTGRSTFADGVDQRAASLDDR